VWVVVLDMTLKQCDNEVMNKQPEHPFKARIPQVVWEELEQLAQHEERSINWEMVQAIRERIARSKKGRKPHEHEDV
jgi:rRNA-processing protein FCF1